MIRKIATVAAIAGVALTYSVSANAMDFPATPMNSGAPTNLPGEHLIPGVTESMQMVNTMTQPILQPMLAPGGMAPDAAAAGPAPMMHHHHHHHHMYMKMHHHMSGHPTMTTMPKQM